jgi:hypothetical protein
MIDNIVYDMIENLDDSKMVDFLRMMDDYKASLYIAESEDFSEDLPF